MRVDAVSHAAGLAAFGPGQRRVVVIDAVRASSTIAHAVAAGAKRVIPVAAVEEAWALRKQLEEERPLLGGERGGLKIEGFDLGNSPESYTPRAVGGRTVIMTTTNGTRAMRAGERVGGVVVGAFVNLPAVVARLLDWGDDVLLAPVGREEAPVLDDTVCAGMYADALRDAGAELSPAAEDLRRAYLPYAGRLLDALTESASGRALIAVGLGSDLRYCAQVGVLDSVPLLDDGAVSEGRAA